MKIKINFQNMIEGYNFAIRITIEPYGYGRTLSSIAYKPTPS